MGNKCPWDEFDGSLAPFLLKTMPLAVVILNKDARVQIMNGAAQRLFRTSNEEAHAQRSGDVFKCINANTPQGAGRVLCVWSV